MLKTAALLEFTAAAVFNSNISLGTTILAGILGVGTLVSIVYGAKWKVTAEAAKSTAEIWQKNAEGERERADVAVADKERVLKTVDELRALVLELKARPDLTSHELHASERHAALIAAISTLGDRIVANSGGPS